MSKEVSRQLLESTLNNIIEVAERMRLEHLQHAAQARYTDADRLRQEQETLHQELGADHPRVKALERARRSAELIAQFADRTQKHAEYRADDKSKTRNYYQTSAPPEHKEDKS